jgi:hypothetical protein
MIEDEEEAFVAKEVAGLGDDYVSQLFGQIDWEARKRPGPHRDNPRSYRYLQ